MVYYLIDDAGALIGPVELPVIPGFGPQLPSNAVDLPNELPEPGTHNVWAMVDGAPKEMPDRRGTVYRTDTGVALLWGKLGELPDGVTEQPSPGQCYIWLNDGWQLDHVAQVAAKAAQALLVRDERMQEASTRIAPLQDAHELGEATESEQSLLIEWKRYRIALNRIEQQEGYPMSIAWPASPGTGQDL